MHFRLSKLTSFLTFLRNYAIQYRFHPFLQLINTFLYIFPLLNTVIYISRHILQKKTREITQLTLRTTILKIQYKRARSHIKQVNLISLAKNLQIPYQPRLSSHFLMPLILINQLLYPRLYHRGPTPLHLPTPLHKPLEFYARGLANPFEII